VNYLKGSPHESNNEYFLSLLPFEPFVTQVEITNSKSEELPASVSSITDFKDTQNAIQLRLDQFTQLVNSDWKKTVVAVRAAIATLHGRSVEMRPLADEAPYAVRLSRNETDTGEIQVFVSGSE
jgi:hypothetical protein